MSAKLQQEACARYVYRNTVENRKQRHELFTTGAMRTCTAPPVTDSEWLANTYFAMTKRGTFDGRVRHCTTVPEVSA
jgi:hypothetical protein